MGKSRQIFLTPKKVEYSYGPYNKFNEKEQWIRITEGCPNNCPYCYEPREFKVFGIPKIVRNKVKIMDMNLLAKPQALNIIKELGNKRVNKKVVYYELVCGIDWRFLNEDLAIALKNSRFKKIRLAWDWGFEYQKEIKDAINLLKSVGYASNRIMVFMICNWKIPYKTNLKKLDLLKVWNVQVCDCYFDNQIFPKVLPIHWSETQNKDFRRKCRKHNQLVNFGIDPEFKKEVKK